MNGNKILLVDDEADILHVIKKGLEANGFVVDAFTDPKECLACFKPGDYNLVILDIRMPGMTGFQLLREIKKIDDSANAFFLTSFEIHENEWQLMFPSVEVKGFIKKPVALQDLLWRLSQLL